MYARKPGRTLLPEFAGRCIVGWAGSVWLPGTCLNLNVTIAVEPDASIEPKITK